MGAKIKYMQYLLLCTMYVLKTTKPSVIKKKFLTNFLMKYLNTKISRITVVDRCI